MSYYAVYGEPAGFDPFSLKAAYWEEEEDSDYPEDCEDPDAYDNSKDMQIEREMDILP